MGVTPCDVNEQRTKPSIAALIYALKGADAAQDFTPSRSVRLEWRRAYQYDEVTRKKTRCSGHRHCKMPSVPMALFGVPKPAAVSQWQRQPLTTDASPTASVSTLRYTSPQHTRTRDPPLNSLAVPRSPPPLFGNHDALSLSLMHHGGYRGRGRGEARYRGSESATPPVDAGSLTYFFHSVDGANYAVLKQLTNRTYPLVSHQHPGMSITFLSIQPDPFAPGSQVRVSVPTPFALPRDASDVLRAHSATVSTGAASSEKGGVCGNEGDLPSIGISDEVSVAGFYDSMAQVAAEDYVLRCAHSGFREYGCNGAVQLLRPSQHVLPRSAVTLTEDGGTLNMHLRVKLPGHGRRIDGRGATQILLRELQPLIESHVCNLDRDHLREHVISVQDQEWLRHQLRPRGLVAFVADGAILPRAAGDSDLPLTNAVPFVSPTSLSVDLSLPFSKRRITGMGLPRGLTLIAGGGFHGKSTLLRALELGVYNHVPSDGRTLVATDPSAVKIRAEDRRSVHGVDISPFIRNLPLQKDTSGFATGDASGSTSQAANIMEALELGCSALLLDEDTSATNFMYRDALMQELVPARQEPITPFVERIGELIGEHDVSAVMVVGGSGQYFRHADVVLVLSSYRVADCTAKAKAIVARSDAAANGGDLVSSRKPLMADRERAFHFSPSQPQQPRRMLYDDTFSFVRHRKGREGTKISSVGLDTIRLSEEDINVGLVEQLVEEGQLNGIAQCIALFYDGGAANAERAQTGWLGSLGSLSALYPPTLSFPRQAQESPPAVTGFRQLIANGERELRRARLELKQPSCHLPTGFTALPRTFEVAAALNRLRTLCTRVK